MREIGDLGYFVLARIMLAWCPLPVSRVEKEIYGLLDGNQRDPADKPSFAGLDAACDAFLASRKRPRRRGE